MNELYLWLRVRKLMAGVASRLGRRALAKGVAPSMEHRALIRRLRPRTVVDVGANRGQFALLCLTTLPDAQILSFEPAERAFEVLSAVTAGGRVKAIRAAIAADRGDMTLNVTAEDDSSSLLPVGELQTTLFGTRVVRQETVQAGPLDAFLQPQEIVAPALLKIDVQGAELLVLQGCASLLAKFRWVYVECSFAELYRDQPLANEIIAFLAAAGFRIAGAFNQIPGRTDPAVQADVLFVADRGAA